MSVFAELKKLSTSSKMAVFLSSVSLIGILVVNIFQLVSKPENKTVLSLNSASIQPKEEIKILGEEVTQSQPVIGQTNQITPQVLAEEITNQVLPIIKLPEEFLASCDDCLIGKQIKDSAIDSSEIENKSIQSADLGSNQVNSRIIEDQSIQRADLSRSLQDTINQEESDPIFSSWNKSTGITIQESQITNLQSYLTSISGLNISDLTNDANYITDGNTNWNNSYGFITDLSSFTTDNLTQGTTNKYTQWTTNGTTISYANNVGIGTTTPQNKLQIYTGDGTSGLRTSLICSNPTVNKLLTDASGNLICGTDQTGSGTGNLIDSLADTLASGNDANSLGITNLGNVGIGTTNPTTALQIGTGFNITSLGVISGASGNISMWTNNSGYITDGNTNWDNSYGFLTSYTETDPVFLSWDKTTGITIQESQISDLQSYLTSYTETDPVFLASQASNITASHITILGNTSNTNTGDETTSSIKTKLTVADTDTDGYLSFTDWNIFNSKQSAGSYLTSYTETDPVFVASEANNITADHLTTLNNTSGTNTGDQSASDLLIALKTVDGSTSGIDADFLDGFDSSAFGDATAANQTTILSRIGTNADSASMDSTLFAGQEELSQTLGTNDDNNTFDSDGVLANENGSVLERQEFAQDQTGGLSPNQGMYSNRIILMTPAVAYTEVCFKSGATSYDYHSSSASTSGGNCVPGDVGFIVEKEERAASYWELAKEICLRNNMRLAEPFEWKLTCKNASTWSVNSMTGNWEWASNFALPLYLGSYNGVGSAIAGYSGCSSFRWHWIGDNAGGEDSDSFRCFR